MLRAALRIGLWVIGAIILVFAALSLGAAIYYGWIAQCTGLVDCKENPAVVATFLLVGFPSGLVGLGAVLAARAMK